MFAQLQLLMDSFWKMRQGVCNRGVEARVEFPVCCQATDLV